MLDLTCILFFCDALAFFRSKTNLDRSKLNIFLGSVQNKSNRSNKCVSSEDFYRSKTILDSFKLFLTRPNCFRQVQTVFYQNKNYHWTPFKEFWSAQNNLDGSKIVSDLHKDKALADLMMAYSCIILGPSFIYNWSISHILEHKFFCLGRFCSWATFESGFCGHFFFKYIVASALKGYIISLL